MTWTYGGDPSAEPRDAVRFLIGDTDTTDQQVTNEEIAYALSENNDQAIPAAAMAVRGLVAKYSRLSDTDIESISIKYSQIAANYASLLDRLESKAADSGASAAIPRVSGVSVSDMESNTLNTDRVPSAFRVGQFANPPLDLATGEAIPTT